MRMPKTAQPEPKADPRATARADELKRQETIKSSVAKAGRDELPKLGGKA